MGVRLQWNLGQSVRERQELGNTAADQFPTVAELDAHRAVSFLRFHAPLPNHSCSSGDIGQSRYQRTVRRRVGVTEIEPLATRLLDTVEDFLRHRLAD